MSCVTRASLHLARDVEDIEGERACGCSGRNHAVVVDALMLALEQVWSGRLQVDGQSEFAVGSGRGRSEILHPRAEFYYGDGHATLGFAGGLIRYHAFDGGEGQAGAE